jgi:hypothetical protein
VQCTICKVNKQLFEAQESPIEDAVARAPRTIKGKENRTEPSMWTFMCQRHLSALPNSQPYARPI